MCGRYFIAIEDEESEIKKIIEQVNIRYKNTPELSEMKTGEIYPTNIVPVITEASIMLMKWGFTRFEGKGQVINARFETSAEKPMFRKSFFEHRCLIPASYYYEWEKRGTKKQKYAIGLRETLYFAGLYRVDKDISVPRFVILTRPGAPKIAFIHDRMPVILSKEIHKAWLNRSLDNEDMINYSVENLSYTGINIQSTLF